MFSLISHPEHYLKVALVAHSTKTSLRRGICNKRLDDNNMRQCVSHHDSLSFTIRYDCNFNNLHHFSRLKSADRAFPFHVDQFTIHSTPGNSSSLHFLWTRCRQIKTLDSCPVFQDLSSSFHLFSE